MHWAYSTVALYRVGVSLLPPMSNQARSVVIRYRKLESQKKLMASLQEGIWRISASISAQRSAAKDGYPGLTRDSDMMAMQSFSHGVTVPTEAHHRGLVISLSGGLQPRTD